MQYTSHYNLMLPEGTDIVNPLVQQNPNFSDIDAAMFANKQNVVGSATELTAGTVHTITRANTDSNVIKFTATSNWTAGDSMVIDSTPVSVFLSDGTVPGTGAYIINTEVLLILNGYRVTLLTSKGAPDAADVDYNNTQSGLAATDVQDAIDELASRTVLARVTADGVKTHSTLLRELYAALNTQTPFVHMTLEFNASDQNLVFVPSSWYSTYMIFTKIFTGTAFTANDSITIAANQSMYYRARMESGSTTFEDRSSTVPAAGSTWTIYR